MSLLLQDGTNLLLQDGTNLLLQAGAPPVFTVQPVDASVFDLTNASFTGLATSDTPITYQWYEAPSTPIGGEVSTTYIRAAVIADTGKQFFLRATNDAGFTDSDTVTLTVKEQSFSITLQPVAASKIEEESVTFSGEAVGLGVTYQWYDGLGALGGETGTSLTFQTSLSDNAREFYFIATDTYGNTLQSDTVVLTVVAKQGENPQRLKMKNPSGQWIDIMRNMAQYGGVRLDTPTALADMAAAVFQTVPFDAGVLSSPRGITQDFANNGIRFSNPGVYRFSGMIRIEHDSIAGNIRNYDIRLYNATDAASQGSVTVLIGRSDEQSFSSVSLLVEIGASDIGDLYQLEVGNSSAAVTGVTVEQARMDVNAVSELLTS